MMGAGNTGERSWQVFAKERRLPLEHAASRVASKKRERVI